MKASKVFTVLFGVAQLILFIKLLDLIQGSDASSHNATPYSASGSNAASSGVIFKHLEKHDRTDSGRAAAAVTFKSSSDAKEPAVNPAESGRSSNSSLTDVNGSQSEGRGCPACTGSDCEASVTSLKYTVPIIPLKIVAVIGVLWLIFYLKVWRFPHRPATQHSGYPASVGGYGGYPSAGYSSGGYSSGGYGGGYPSTDSGYSGGADGAGGVLDSVMRAIEKFSQ